MTTALRKTPSGSIPQKLKQGRLWPDPAFHIRWHRFERREQRGMGLIQGSTTRSPASAMAARISLARASSSLNTMRRTPRTNWSMG